MSKNISYSVEPVKFVIKILWKFFFSAGSTGSNVQSGVVSLPIAQNSAPTVTSGETSQPILNLSSISGGTLLVENFLTSPDTYRDPVNAGYYSLGYPVSQATVGTSTPPYLIMYIAATQFFTIELLQEPIGETRTQVELYLEQHLGLTPDDLCKLNYTLSVPVSVNKIYAGKNLGFSFCPGATILPK